MDSTSHAPVLLEESLALLLPEAANGRELEGATFVDATFGGGGHTSRILARSGARVVAFDADPEAAQRADAMAKQWRGQLIATHANFADLATVLDSLGIAQIDGILYDLGLSSLQLADEGRGFSVRGDAPLDMRLNRAGSGETAEQLLGRLSERDLADILYRYGDERHARRIARAIAARRERRPLRTTTDLVDAVMAAQPRGARWSRIHPATRTFQAFRMAVNQELENLERSLDAAFNRLRAGARAVVISFHSGEDRIVKTQFKRWSAERRAAILTRKPIVPSREEVRANPRSRSAKLRAAEKIGGDVPWQ